MTTFLIPTLIVAGLFIAWSLRVTFSFPGKLVIKAAVACLSLLVAIACAIGAIHDRAPEQLGLVVVFIGIHISAVISYTAGQILARLDSCSSSQAKYSAPNQKP
jgi:predicted Na+-dependent transporter